MKQNKDSMTFRLEADLTKHVKAYLKSLEPLGYFTKISDKYHSGISDFIGCYRGFYIAIELKAEDGQPTAKQLEYLGHIAGAGGYILVSKTVEDVKNIIQQIDKQLDL